MRERLSDYQEQYGDLYNLEATPAESTTYRLAKHDMAAVSRTSSPRRRNGDTPYYTNSSHLPVGYTEDIFDALDVQDELQTLYTSGTVFHAFLGEKLPGLESPPLPWCARSQRTTELPYYTLSPTYSDLHRTMAISTGEQYACPICGADNGGIQPHHRLLPAGAELERRQESGISGPKDLSGGRRTGALPEDAGGQASRKAGRGILSLHHRNLPELPQHQAHSEESGRFSLKNGMWRSIFRKRQYSD